MRFRCPPRGVPEGPVFISYRHADGAETAEVLTMYLRTGGLVPWFDEADLGGGLVVHNIRRAIQEGISAGILLVTKGIGDSAFVKEEELPRLVGLDTWASRRQSVLSCLGRSMPKDFTLYVLCALGAGITVDPDEADRLLETGAPENARRLGGQCLRTRLQYAPNEIGRLLDDLLRRRIQARHQDLTDRQVTVWVQTRPAPHVDRFARLPFAASTIDLSVRLRQDPTTSIPRELDYRCLQLTLPHLADAIYAAVLPHRTDERGAVLAPKVTFAGGGHPSVMWALGAARPEARHALGTVGVVDIRSSAATGGPPLRWSEHAPEAGPQYTVSGARYSDDTDSDPAAGGGSRKLAILLAGTRRVKLGVLFALRSRLTECQEAVVLQVVRRDGVKSSDYFPAEEGFGLAKEFAEQLRDLHREGFDLHVACALPVGLVVLIARLCNTVPVTFYEPASTPDGRDEYTAVLRIEPGRALGPIVEVYPHRAVPAPVDPTRLVNLTPHDVTLFDGEDPVHTWPATETSEGRDLWVRRDDAKRRAGALRLTDGAAAPLWDLTPGPLTNLPPVEPGTCYIVPHISAEAAQRTDFVFPEDEVRDTTGRIIGCRSFGRFPSTDAERKLRLLIPEPR